MFAEEQKKRRFEAAPLAEVPARQQLALTPRSSLFEPMKQEIRSNFETLSKVLESRNIRNPFEGIETDNIQEIRVGKAGKVYSAETGTKMRYTLEIGADFSFFMVSDKKGKVLASAMQSGAQVMLS
jgi:hypothetical protein